MNVIYKITSGDRFYIGSTNDFKRRFKEHKWTLERGTHVNRYLQAVHDKYNDLEYTIIEEVAGNLFEREQEYINECFNDNGCMNINPKASQPTPNENSWKAAATVNTGIKRSDECKRKMSDAKKELLKKNPDFLTERQAKGRANRYAKLPEFVLIKDGIEYGPYKQQQEAYEELPLSNVSVSRLFLGKLKEVKGFTLKFT
jgi:group I intron endonuclease